VSPILDTPPIEHNNKSFLDIDNILKNKGRPKLDNQTSTRLWFWRRTTGKEFFGKYQKT